MISAVTQAFLNVILIIHETKLKRFSKPDFYYIGESVSKIAFSVLSRLSLKEGHTCAHLYEQ